METWAHGLDVADALGVQAARDGAAALDRPHRRAHPRLRVRRQRLDSPADPFRVELRAPDGSTWSWGPDDAAQRVTGSAEDFCMLVTQRGRAAAGRHRRGRRRRAVAGHRAGVRRTAGARALANRPKCPPRSCRTIDLAPTFGGRHGLLCGARRGRSSFSGAAVGCPIAR